MLPWIRTGGASGGTFGFPMGTLKKPSFATHRQWFLIASKTASIGDSAKAIVEVVQGFMTHSPGSVVTKTCVSEPCAGSNDFLIAFKDFLMIF